MSSASATVTPAPSVETVLRSGGKSRGRSSASSWWIRSGSASPSSRNSPRSLVGTSSSATSVSRGHEDLAAVTGVRDARGAHDVDARVALVAEHRSAGVQSRSDADADPARPLGVPQPALDLERGAGRARSLAERRDVFVPDGVRLRAAAGRDRLAQRAAKERDRVGVVDGSRRSAARSNPPRLRRGT